VDTSKREEEEEEEEECLNNVLLCSACTDWKRMNEQYGQDLTLSLVCVTVCIGPECFQ
jgi:hypothetical protein